MKRLCFLVLVSATLWAQTPTAQTSQRNVAITKSDVYCSGFVGKALPETQFVAAGLNTPNQTRYVDRDYIFLRGSGYQPGTKVGIVRHMTDPSRYSPMKGEGRLLSGLGEVYNDIGYATVVELRGTDIAVAQVDMSCETIVPGDLVVPYAERTMVKERHQSTFDRFPAGAPKLSGRIVAARDFDQFVAAGHKVFVNVGADKGLKAGDYLQVVRGYERKDQDKADDISYSASYMEDTQKHPRRLTRSEEKNLPRRVVGELIVLSTQGGTATGMILNALEEIHVGDRVEMQ